jgi:hypothetical protein
VKEEIVKFLQDFSKNQFSSEMEKKYWRKLPSITIKETVQYIVDNKLQSILIDKEVNDLNEIFNETDESINESQFTNTVYTLKGNKPFKKPYLFYKVKDKFELFKYDERGGYTFFISTPVLKSALFEYVESIFNDYGVNASDTRIC